MAGVLPSNTVENISGVQNSTSLPIHTILKHESLIRFSCYFEFLTGILTGVPSNIHGVLSGSFNGILAPQLTLPNGIILCSTTLTLMFNFILGSMNNVWILLR